MKNSYQLLIEKLDKFIRKFYLNQLIRGSLYSIAIILALFIAFSVAEHYFYFDKSVRKVLFYSFIGISGISLFSLVIRPLLNYFQLGSLISHEQAATIIGEHFSNVQDKLLNVLQLKKQADSAQEGSLIFASIDQKSAEISPVPFRTAINLNNNKKHLKYALPPLLLLLLLLITAPSMIKDSTQRLIQNNQDFERPAPFSFTINEEDLKVVQFEDKEIGVKITGETLPNDVFIQTDFGQYKLKKVQADSFTYRFNKVQKSIDFSLSAANVFSQDYSLDVLLRPNLSHFEVQLDYPAYVGRKDETLNSIGNITVPKGTQVNWIFHANHTDALDIFFSGDTTTTQTQRSGENKFTLKKQVFSDQNYTLYIGNKALPNADSIAYALSVVPDLYPQISVEQFIDSTQTDLLFFVGKASDDYGLSTLSFNYKITHEDGSEAPLQKVALKSNMGKETSYDYTFDIQTIESLPGDEITYYFEVFDNDKISGHKSAKTNMMVYRQPTEEEIEDIIDEKEEKIKDNIEAALKEAKDIQEDLKEMKQKLLQEKELDWKDKKELEKLIHRQEELQKNIEQAKKAHEENMQQEQQMSEQNQKIMEKQEKLQEMFEEVMDEEMKELMEQIQELLQEMEKDEAIEKMEEMEMNDEEVEMELDRMLEMYKEMEVEKEMQEAIDKLEELAEKQEELSEETKEGEKDQEELKEEQEKINEEFEKLKEDMEELEKKNQELENPKEMENQDEEMDDIQEDLDDSQEQLEQEQNSGASESQKGAAEKMKKMASSMSMQMQSQEMEQAEEDMKALRQLLENIVGLSFDQEDLIDQFGQTTINTPKYVELVQHQFKLQDDFKLVEDSLQQLSKRVHQLESFVTEKVIDIKYNMKDAIKHLEDRKVPNATGNQQFTMTNLNDLALMLSEAMNQMQQQMSGMMSGNQMCNKPGGKGQGKSPKDKMSQGQKSLNQQMKDAIKQMQDGRGASAEQFAKMAAKQNALRNALRQKEREMQQQGQGTKELSDLIEQMNKVETDLVNKKLTNEMMKRQEEILSRLLKHEKAERERDLDQKRKAEVAEQYKRQMPPSLEEYIKKRQAEVEMFKTVSPQLTPYYKSLVEEYFKSLQ